MQTQNQDMMEQNLVLREKVKTLEQQCSDENTHIHRQFIKEMSLCYTELQALVQICVQRAEGQDPNMSLLLGVPGSRKSVIFLEMSFCLSFIHPSIHHSITIKCCIFAL